MTKLVKVAGPGLLADGAPGVEGSADIVPALQFPEVEPTRFGRMLMEAADPRERRLSAQGVPINRWPMMAYHGASGSPGLPRDPGARPIRVDGQDGWSHDEGHAYGVFNTFDALKLGSWPPRKIHVFVPRDLVPGHRYPVVYMNDGQNVFFPGGPGGTSWNVAETISSLVAEGRMRPVIVVAIHPLNRAPEYTWIDRAPGVMRVQEYGEFVGGDLKRFIDANYPTDPSAEVTSIVGSSHGGLAAFHMATRHPEIFGQAVSMSSSFWHGVDKGGRGGPLKSSPLITGVESLLADPGRRPKLWIDWGLVRDGGPHNWDIEALATRRSEELVDLLGSEFGYVQGRDLFAFEDPAGEHDERSWGRHFAGAMEAIYGPTAR